MSSWSKNDLHAIAANDDLFVSPFRDDGATYGTPTQTWALVIDGDVYVRAASGHYEVTFEQAGEEVSDAIDAAYEAKYPGSSAVPIMQGDGPKSATVRISPR
jgi:hypothetical protein